ncbi:MAG: DUF4960 domain-containing protein [Prevotella sp.]|nr:DUF4960 domain-containing protein [Bacteroides sp.]MCM1366897.1 DUF4960 domain-containing protein [Prevotella sp.]MCM1437442.1 DUF4960 domain-containing protein [Prevotella sp.]
MKKIQYFFLSIIALVAITSCQDDDYNISAPVIAPIDANLISGNMSGDDLIWQWPDMNGLKMEVNRYEGSTFVGAETVDGNSYTHKNIDTNIEYTYVFKLSDGKNVSLGAIKKFIRQGASKMLGLAMSQIEKSGGYDAKVEWNQNPSAQTINFVATNGSRTISESLPGETLTYTIPNVNYGDEWTVTLTAQNEKGSSLPVSTSLKIGKTAIGFLSIYPTPEKLVADGDDDEASAWLWLHEEYPTAQFLYFGDIKSAKDLEPFRVIFWMRDLEGVTEAEVLNMPEIVENATPYVKEWYKDGGNMLLWSHATPYIGVLGRIEMDMIKNNDRSIGTGVGGYNGDVWSMAISLNPGGKFTKDHSTHPIYKGLTVTSNDRCKLVQFKGPGWTEDHNCLFFNIPSALTGLGNQDEACYNALTQTYGIYPLGTWDSQIDWVSQLNVWEAQQGNTEFKGTILCIGNGGCEFSLKNPDGSPDKSAHPKNNQFQDNVLKLAKNSLEYLKTR